MTGAEPILDVRGLTVEFSSEDGPLRAVDDVSFQVGRGEILGLVGESGAGKSLTSEAILRLIRCPPGRVTGEVWFRGQNLLALDERSLADIRGKDIAMIFQNPGASLNPVFRVGVQMLEAMTLHLPEPRQVLRERVIEILGRVGISSPRTRTRDYPHQFSGGMAQRVMIGMGVSCVPSLLIADEPTTALDVTIQAQVLALIRRLARELGRRRAPRLARPRHHFPDVPSPAGHVRGPRGRAGFRGTRSSARPLIPIRAGSSAACRGRTVVARLGAIGGTMPGLRTLPSGCRFHPRCPVAEPRCSVEAPALGPLRAEHDVACHVARAS